MPRFALSLAASLALAAPVAAQPLTVLLPALSFPDTTGTTSTKGCDGITRPATCHPGK